MSAQIGFPLYSLQAIDPKTGQWNREWWLFLQYLWQRSGGSDGQSSSDLSADMPEDAGIEELKASLASLANEVNQAPPGAFSLSDMDTNALIQELIERVTVLSVQIDAINQGPSL
jgi:hypothetical protein